MIARFFDAIVARLFRKGVRTCAHCDMSCLIERVPCVPRKRK